MDYDSALKFLELLAQEVKIKYSLYEAQKILKQIDPYGVGLDYKRFQIFFFETTEQARKEGGIKLSESMYSSELKLKKNEEIVGIESEGENDDMNFSSHIQTDKPIYKPGEIIYWRAWIVHALTQNPLKNQDAKKFFDEIGPAKLELISPGEEVVTTKIVSYGDDEFVNLSDFVQISEEQVGGNYKLKLSFEYFENFPSAERSIQIKTFSAPPKLNLQLEFLKKGLGPNDDATALLEVARSDLNIPVGATITSTARIDGKEVWSDKAILGENGKLEIKFKLPKEIIAGEGTLTCVVQDGGTTESTGQTIPIILKKLDLVFFAEGGEFVSGLPNTLYFESKTPYGDSADFLGQIIDGKGNAVSTIQTNHEGRGKTSFTPKDGEKYKVKILSPSGITFQNELPQAKKEGVVVSSVCDVYNDISSIKFLVGSTNEKKYKVVLSKKFKSISTQTVELKGGEVKEIVFDVSKFQSLVHGVLRVTVFTEMMVPLAERIIYCEPPTINPKFSIELNSKNSKYSVGENVVLSLDFYSQKNSENLLYPTSEEDYSTENLFFGVSVVDESVLEMVTKRKQVPRLPVMIFLENEVDRLDDAKIFLDRSNPNSKLALDLLLGTQGWRRFAFSDESFLEVSDEVKERLFGKSDASSVSIFETIKKLEKEVREFEKERRIYINEREKYCCDEVESISYSSYESKSNTSSIFTSITSLFDKSDSKDKSELNITPKSLPQISDKKVVERKVERKIVSKKIVEKEKQRKTTTEKKKPQNIPKNKIEMKSKKQSEGKRMKIQEAQKDEAEDLNISYMSEQLDVSERSQRLEDILISYNEESEEEKQKRKELETLQNIVYNCKYVTRVFAHSQPQNKTVRDDFSTTLLWVGGEKVNLRKYKNQIVTLEENKRDYHFTLSDSITSFRIYVEGITENGLPFCHSQLITSTKSFYLDAKLPIEVSGDDRPILPLTIVNETGKDLSEIELKFSRDKEGIEFDEKSGKQIVQNIENGQRKRVNIPTTVSNKDHDVSIKFEAKIDENEDVMKQTTKIKAKGFPFELFASGELKSENPIETHSFNIPKDVCEGSISTSIKLYLTPLSNMTAALAKLIQSPWGCFEQTSSVVYPMVMAQQYFLSHKDCPEDLVGRAKEKISEGYNRLKGFGVDKGSGKLAFDWYGSPPGNESLSSYGLLEFNDMKQVFPVENEMLEKVKNWLLSRRDGKGGFERSEGRYGFGNAPKEITNAYICWALTEQGIDYSQIQKEVDELIPLCKTTKKNDPYFLSLVICVLYNLKLNEKAEEISYQLTELQREDGCVCGKNDPKLHDTRFTSITYAWGDSLFVSSTGLAIYSWLKAGTKYSTFVMKAQKWLMNQCKGGAFGSTDATINALKAIVEFDKIYARCSNSKLSVLLNGDEISTVILDEETLKKFKGGEPFQFESFADKLVEGGNFDLQIKMETEKGVSACIPYSVDVLYSSLLPDDHPNVELEISTQLSSEKMKEGEGSELNVVITNKNKDNGQPMTLAIIGLPGGLEVRTEKLDELVKSEKIDFYEMRGRELCIYWIAMDKNQQVKLQVDVVAKIPGSYFGSASRVYLYYTDEEKKWCKPLFVEIEPNSD